MKRTRTNRAGSVIGTLVWMALSALGVQSAEPARSEAPAGPVTPNATNSAPTHWAYRPLAAVPLPPAAWPASVRNPIDRFIQTRLVTAGLEPSPEADRRTLVRRLYLDLHGLPPTPAEIDAFENDHDPLAWERLIDRLLDSPRYGERWARHWLDSIAFGETHGFEVNTPRDNAWPYRDYVIRALNADKPYPTFILDQLAGDTTGEDAATGFIVAAAALLPGQIGRDLESMLLARQDELNDMVLIAGSTFLGLTINCARCHDHKFDPISQTDYFSMQAVFAGVRHGERPWGKAVPPEQARQIAEIRREVSAIEQRLARFEPFADVSSYVVREPDPQFNEERFAPIDADYVRFTVHDANRHPTLGLIEPCLDELEVFTAGPDARNVALASTGAKATASGSQTSDRHRLEHVHDGRPGNNRSWMSNEAGRGWVQIEFAQRERVERVVWSRDRLGEFRDRLPTRYAVELGQRVGTGIAWTRVAGTPALRPAVNPRLTVERFPPTEARRLRFTVLATSNLEPCLDELEVFSASEPTENLALASRGTRATASGTIPGSSIHRLEHLNDGRYGNERSWISNESGKGWVELEFPSSVKIERVAWSRDRNEKYTDRLPLQYRIEVSGEDGTWRLVASSADRRAYSLGAPTEVAYRTEGLDPAQRAEVDALAKRRVALGTELRQLERVPMVYAGRFEKTPEPVFRLNRGDPMQRREPVVPAALSRIGPRLELAADTPESERRVALARWIGSAENPLTARVLVNRLWQHHFGEGLVATTSDFGNKGARPTHPELLDWLAGEFIAQGWSLKAVHRLLCNSATYRQSSRPNPRALSVDAGSRLWWRFLPRRLEAEAIRDSILSVAGTLDLRMGGPGFSVFRPNDNYVRVYDPREDFGPGEWRRMIYMTKVRMAQDGTFGAFDCPDAGQVQPKRPRSTTPIQALNLFNSAFVNQQSERFAERLRATAGAAPEAQIQSAFRLAFGRDPASDEQAACLPLVQEHGLAHLGRVLFNANEFLQLP